MTITELITALETIRAEYGDIQVVTGDEYFYSPTPEVQPEDWDCIPYNVKVPYQVVLQGALAPFFLIY